MSTAIVTSDTSEDHITGDGHPEQPKRVSAVVRRLKKRKNLLWVKSEKFDLKILKKVGFIKNFTQLGIFDLLSSGGFGEH